MATRQKMQAILEDMGWSLVPVRVARERYGAQVVADLEASGAIRTVTAHIGNGWTFTAFKRSVAEYGRKAGA